MRLKIKIYSNSINEPKNVCKDKHVLYKDKKKHEMLEQGSKSFKDLKENYEDKLKNLRNKNNKEIINEASEKKIDNNKNLLQKKTVIN